MRYLFSSFFYCKLVCTCLTSQVNDAFEPVVVMLELAAQPGIFLQLAEVVSEVNNEAFRQFFRDLRSSQLSCEDMMCS